MVYTQSEPTNQKTDQYSSRHTKIVAKKNPKWKGFVLLPIDPQWFPWRNLCFWTFARCSHYTWRLCCRPLTYEKGWKPTRRSQHHPLVAPNYISSLLRQKNSGLCLPSRGWFMKPKRLLNSQSISPKTMTATLGQSPIGWWRMLCGRAAAAENTITTSLWPCFCGAGRTNLVSLMLTNGREAAVMNAPGRAALFKYTFLESQELTGWRCQPARTDGAISTRSCFITSALMPS